MRICVTHWKPATEILVSKMTGSEYDLCAECVEAMHGLLIELPQPAKNQSAPRVDGRTRAARAKRQPKAKE